VDTAATIVVASRVVTSGAGFAGVYVRRWPADCGTTPGETQGETLACPNTNYNVI